MSTKIRHTDTVIGTGGPEGKPPYMFLHERIEHREDKDVPYWFASREEHPGGHKTKKPDAVIVCAFYENSPWERRLIITKEWRVPIGDWEYGFPAGKIDPGEYAGDAAIREMKEETGLDLTVYSVSPPNLYSSAGLTDESVQIVFGEAFGEPSQEFLTEDEDIEVILADWELVQAIASGEKDEWAFGSKAWCLIHGIVETERIALTALNAHLHFRGAPASEDEA